MRNTRTCVEREHASRGGVVVVNEWADEISVCGGDKGLALARLLPSGGTARSALSEGTP